MYQFSLEIDPELLEKQIKALTEVTHNYWPVSDSPRNSLEGVLNLLGAIRDQIDPPLSIGEKNVSNNSVG